MLANKLMSALSGGAEDKLYVDDVFSAYTYTGNGSTQMINNGIDLAGKGGMVWARARDSASGGHFLSDTARGINNVLSSNSPSGNSAATYYTGVTSSGFGLSSNAVLNGTGSVGFGASYISWTFRKAPKFFDVVQFTYSGATAQTITHNLGSIPGMILVKKIIDTSSWFVYHRGLPTPTDNYLFLEQTAPYTTFASIWGTGPTATDFQIKGMTTGETYIAYLFAHDPSADGIIQCGVYTGNSSSSGPTVELGWEPQYVLVKSVLHTADWWLWDSSRGLTNNGGNEATDPALRPNLVNDEITSTDNQIRPLSTGFQLRGSGSETNFNGYNYIYLAIRRPNKPPTTGTQVYNATTSNTNSLVNVGFPADLFVHCGRGNANPQGEKTWIDRLRGSKSLVSTTTAVESNSLTSWDRQNSFVQGFASLTTEVSHFFRRAPGFFDVVCYKGTGVAQTVPHNLGVAPELMIVKSRSLGVIWAVCVGSKGVSDYLMLDSTSGYQNNGTGTALWSSTPPTSSVFSVGTNNSSNGNSATYVAYLFASLPGISKCGNYTGNGTTQTINCGFTTGARFILIKRTDAAGDWYVWNSVRGIVAGNDPYLSLNTSATEITTDDSVDPGVSGFIVNQVAATNINVSGGRYIFLAIA